MLLQINRNSRQTKLAYRAPSSPQPLSVVALSLVLGVPAAAEKLMAIASRYSYTCGETNHDGDHTVLPQRPCPATCLPVQFPSYIYEELHSGESMCEGAACCMWPWGIAGFGLSKTTSRLDLPRGSGGG